MYYKLTFVSQPDKYYNKLLINNLQEGQYILFLKDVNRKINIVVHKGEYWENNSFILKRTCLQENRASSKLVKIANINSN